MDKYISQGQVGGPANTTSNVRLDNSGDMALMRQQAGVGNAILAGAKMFVDQMQDTDITKASNMYNDKMSELRSQLMQNREENALDNMAKYEEGRRKILDDIYRTGPRFVRDGQGRQKFELAIEKDWIGQKNQMRGYVMGESEKYADNQTNNRLFGYNQNISEGYNNPMVLETNVDAGVEEVAKRYKYYGPERIEAAARQWKAQAYGNAITTALANNDYDTAGTLLQGNGKWLDPKTRASLDKLIVDRKRNDFMLSNVNGLFSKHGKDMNAAWAEYSMNIGQNSGNTVAKYANSMIGQQLGNNTCAIFVGNVLTATGGDKSLISTLADGTYVNYENKGLTFNDRSQLKDGDLVFWSVDGSGYTASDNKEAVNSSDQAYKGITHVGVYDAKTGKVIQSGTHGVSAMDIDTKGYNFVGAAHQPVRAMSPTEMEQRKKEFMSSYGVLVNQQKYQQGLVVENAANNLLAMFKDGQQHSEADYEKVVYGVTGNNYEMYSKLQPLAKHFAKGTGYHDLSIVEAYALERAIDTGSISQEDLKDMLIKMNVKPSTAMDYLHKNKAAMAKEDKVNWTQMQKAFKSIDGMDKVTDVQMMGVMMAAKRYVAEYTQDPKTRGQVPSTDAILNYMQDSILTGAAGEAAGGFGDYSVERMMRAGIYRIDKRADGKLDVYFFGTDTPFPYGITEEQLAERMKE